MLILNPYLFQMEVRDKLKLIIGLGNPGRQYSYTRHNVGYDVVELLARRYGIVLATRKCQAMVGEISIHDERVLLAKPLTYMNLSGDSVSLLVRRNNIKLDDLLVIYDDLDLPLGRLRIRPSGSAGGHNGMKSIIARLGANDFPRIRLGIGREGDAVEHVLSRFNKREREQIDFAIDRAADATEAIIINGLENAMNAFNRSQEEEQ